MFTFPAKLVGQVGAHLTAAGHRTQLFGLSRPHARPDPTVLAALPGPVGALFGHRIAACGGLVRGGRGVDPPAVVTALLRALPRHRTVVAVKNRDEVRYWLRRLARASLPQRLYDSWALLHRGWGWGPKVLVTTPAVLEHPDDDFIRWEYAEALDRAGDAEGAELIRDGIGATRVRAERGGHAAGLPYAVRVGFDRGFVTWLAVGREGVPRLGDALRDHPVARVVIEGPEVVVEVKADRAAPGLRYRRDLPARAWVATMTRPADGPRPVAATQWPTRAEVVDQIGQWVAANLPPDRDAEAEFLRSLGIRT